MLVDGVVQFHGTGLQDVGVGTEAEQEMEHGYLMAVQQGS